MNISLPAPLRDWVQKQVKDGNYGSSSEFVREMLRRIRDEQSFAGYEEALLAAIESPVVPADDAFWRRIRSHEGNKDAAARHQRRLDASQS